MVWKPEKLFSLSPSPSPSHLCSGSASSSLSLNQLSLLLPALDHSSGLREKNGSVLCEGKLWAESPKMIIIMHHLLEASRVSEGEIIQLISCLFYSTYFGRILWIN